MKFKLIFVLIGFAAFFCNCAVPVTSKPHPQKNQSSPAAVQPQENLSKEPLPESPKHEAKSKHEEKSYVREVFYPDGSKYVGEIVGGKRHGEGIYAWPSGAKYTGEWRDGKIHGQGTYIWPHGDKYVGEWENSTATGGWLYKASGSKAWAYQSSERKWIIR